MSDRPRKLPVMNEQRWWTVAIIAGWVAVAVQASKLAVQRVDLAEARRRRDAAETRVRELANEAEDRRVRALDRASTMSRWLLASLLTLNGGALVALKDAVLPNAPLARLSFLIGIVFAVLSGLAAWLEGELVSQYYERRQQHFLDYLGGQDVADRSPPRVRPAGWAYLASSIFVLVSLALFVSGALLAGAVPPLF